MKTWDGTGDIAKKYNDYISSSTTATARFGTAIKAFAANAAIMVAITAGIKLIAFTYDQIAHRQENLNEKATESTRIYEELQSEVGSLNEELDTTNSRIKELSEKPNLTFVEQEELENLKETNRELERTLGLKEADTKTAADNARKDALKALNNITSYSSYNGLDDPNTSDSQQALESMRLKDTSKGTQLENAQKQLDDYNRLVDQKEALDKRLDDMRLNDPSGYIYNVDYRNLQAGSDTMGKWIDNLKTDLSAVSGVLDGFKSALDPSQDAELIASINAYQDDYIAKFSLPPKTVTQKFNDIWDSKDFAKQRKEIENLASAKKLEPETLSNTEEYRRLIDETGASAEEVTSNIYALVKAESLVNNRQSSLSYTDTITKLEEMSDAFSAMNSAYVKFIDKDKSIGFEDLAKLNEQFKDVSGIEDYIKAIQDAGGETEATQKAFDNLLSAYLNQTDILDQVNEANAGLIQAYLTEQGVVNADSLVQQALSENLAMVAAEKYYNTTASNALTGATQNEINRILDEAESAGISRAALIELMMTKISCNDTGIVTDGDIQNLIDLANAAGIAEAAVKNAKSAQNQKDKSGVVRSSGAENAINESIVDNLQKGMREELYKPKEYKFSGGSATNDARASNGKGSSGGSNDIKTTEKEFNWIDRKMQHMEDKRQELIDKASSASIPYLGLDNQSASQLQDYFAKTESGIALTGDEFSNLSLIADKVGISVANLFNELKNGGSESRKGYMAQALEIDKKIIEECASDVEYYNALYEEAASKLSDELRIKVETGGDGIETLTGEEAEHVEKAIDALDKRNQALQKEADARQQYSDDSKTYAEIELEYLDKQADAIEHRNNMIQKQIDFLIASGNVVNASAYESLIANLQQEEAILNKKLALKKNELRQKLSSGEISKDDEAYFELLSYINSCEESLADLAIRQEEYHDKIRQLPIENMQKILNMYEDISNALQDYADMVEASGRKLDAEYYQTQIKNGIKTIAQYKEQADLIRDVMDEYDVGSDKYLEMYDKLQDVNASISNIVKNMHEWNKELLALPINSINDQLTGLSEALDAFQAIQIDHETVIAAVTGAINEQIEALEEQRDVESEAAQSEIDALQEKLDLLQKQNEERKIQLALEQAKYDLERAQNQRSNQVVRDGELVWEADQDEIRSASQSVADAQYDKLTHDLEKQKEALEENLTLVEERYQKQIDQLTEMSEKWSKIKSDAEAAADAALAGQYLGEGWKDQVASGNDKDIYEAFRNNYNTNNQMVSKYEKQIQSTEKIYNLLNSYITAYQAGTLSYEQAMASIRALLSQMNHDMTADQSLQNVLDYLGKVNGTDADADSVLSGIQAQLKADSDEMIKNLEQYNDNLSLITDCMTSWEQLTTNIGDIRNLMDDVLEALEDGFDSLAGALENDLRNRKDEEEDDDDDDDSSHSSGTVSAGGTSNSHYTGNDVNHNSDQDPDHGPGVPRYASGIKKGMIRASGKIPTPASVERLKKLSTETFRNNGQVPIIAHEGEVVLNPEQQKKLLDNFDALRHQHFQIPVPPMFSPTQPPTAATYNFGDIQMYGVQDVDGFAQSLKYNAGPIIHQVFSRR